MDSEYFKKNGLRYFGGIIISFFLILANGMEWLNPIYSSGNYIMEPLSYWAGRLVKSGENLISTVVEIGSLRNENNDLKVENAKLKAKMSKLDEVEKENQTLREQIEIEATKDFDLEMVRILGIDENGSAEHVLIDAGEDKGIEKGDAVVIGDILIGEVKEVEYSTSRVRLITSQNSNIIAIDSRTRAKGLVRGSLKGIVMEDVLENEELNEGDSVIVWEDKLPPDLVIGEIKKIDIISTSSTKKAYIESGINIEELNYVFVILDF